LQLQLPLLPLLLQQGPRWDAEAGYYLVQVPCDFEQLLKGISG
jgi:hypothetical protein